VKSGRLMEWTSLEAVRDMRLRQWIDPTELAVMDACVQSTTCACLAMTTGLRAEPWS
jgi:hypothetical protein